MDSDNSDRGTQMGVQRQVLYVDDPTQTDAVAAVVDADHDDMRVVSEHSRDGARQRVTQEPFDCVVVELKFATAVSDVCAETPLVLFTETDPTAISDDLLAKADTLVQKGSECHVDFLVNKIRGIVQCDDGADDDDTERVTDEVPDARTEFFLLDADGTVEWSSTTVSTFFPDSVAAQREEERLHDRLSRTATGEYSYTEEMADAVAAGRSAERVGVELPREAPPGEVPSVTYTCWSYPLDDSARRLEAYREETATIQQSERLARLEELVELARDGLYMIDADARFAFVTERYASMLGYEREELVGRHAAAVMSEGALSRGQKAVESLLNDPECESTMLDQVHETKGGDEIQLSIHFTLITDEDGSYQGLMGVARDVTERRAREQELAQYQSVFETVSDRVYVLDGDGRIRLANETFAALLGSTPERIEGQDAGAVFGPDAYAKIQSVADNLRSSPNEHGEAEITLEDNAGRQIPCETSVSLLPDDQHEGGCVGVVRDISERVQREQQVAVLDRVLRHNLRNDLTVVLSQAELLVDRLDDTESTEMVETIQQRCDRLISFAEKARRAQRVLDHALTESTGTVEVASIVDRVTGRVQRANPDASVSATVSPGVTAGVSQTVTIALTDLVKNAVEHNDAAKPWAEVRVAQTSAVVDITVADDGPGIPANELDVLINGTETPLRHGSGIGFWLVHWIVTQIGGSLSVDDRSPIGSIVRMTLPLDAETEHGRTDI
ncbi:PAS domain-containing sensor histidine kinase [Salinibaculum salinum]|uniref:PAS domain-containing sensor histidine kinase n=1 Tax=Salinibaculum salinum TaxID=3131996 RepID=UPI0030ECB6E8